METSSTCVIMAGTVVGLLVGCPLGTLVGLGLADWWDARRSRRKSGTP